MKGFGKHKPRYPQLPPSSSNSHVLAGWGFSPTFNEHRPRPSSKRPSLDVCHSAGEAIACWHRPISSLLIAGVKLASVHWMVQSWMLWVGLCGSTKMMQNDRKRRQNENWRRLPFGKVDALIPWTLSVFLVLSYSLVNKNITVLEKGLQLNHHHPESTVTGTGIDPIPWVFSYSMSFDVIWACQHLVAARPKGVHVRMSNWFFLQNPYGSTYLLRRYLGSPSLHK